MILHPNTNTERIQAMYDRADIFDMFAANAARIIPFIQARDGKQINSRISKELEAYNTTEARYHYIKQSYSSNASITLDIIETSQTGNTIQLYSTTLLYFNFEGISKGKSAPFMDSNKKLKAAEAIDHINRNIADHKTEATAARRDALEVMDKLEQFNKLIEQAKTLEQSIVTYRGGHDIAGHFFRHQFQARINC